MSTVAKLLLSGAGLVTFGLFTGFTILQYLKRRKYRHIKGPSTRGILGFYLGNSIDLDEAYKKGSTFPNETLKWEEEYGSVYKIQIYSNIMVFVTELSAVKEILVDENFPKYDLIYHTLGRPYGERTIGDGLFTMTDKTRWKPKRTLFNHGFHKTNFNDWMDQFNQHGDIFMEKMRSLADGKTLITFATEINNFAMDVIASTAFNINTGSITDSNVTINVLLNKLLSSTKDFINDPLIMFKPHKRSFVNSTRNSIKYVREFARNNIITRLKLMEDKDYVPKDILSIILSNTQGEIDLEELVDDFVTFFGAGQETTANTLAFSVMELGLNPDIFERARVEIDEVIGSKSEITIEDLNRMEYLNCVFKETLRKYPIAPQLARYTTKDFQVNGVTVPKDTCINVSIYSISRNPKYFPDPEKFEPERFLKGSKIAEQNTINSSTYFPFSLGPRNCIGMNFAQLEARLFLAKFIRNFDLRLDPTQSFQAIEMLTLKPKDGCRIYLTIRENI